MDKVPVVVDNSAPLPLVHNLAQVIHKPSTSWNHFINTVSLLTETTFTPFDLRFYIFPGDSGKSQVR